MGVAHPQTGDRSDPAGLQHLLGGEMNRPTLERHVEGKNNARLLNGFLRDQRLFLDIAST
ncbi:hypothetical protein [Paenibacillus sp. WC2504]|uniref:hypothetical protein n=1 Tax=Paenibacillus sp. WC2504 TaxID=3461403 RepID=UPI0040466B3E